MAIMISIYLIALAISGVCLALGLVIGVCAYLPMVIAGAVGIMVGVALWDSVHHLFAIILSFLAYAVSATLYMVGQY